jgi:ATP-dependent DNA ligase
MSAAPTTASAMKAVLTQERFSDPDWLFERKLDGIRDATWVEPELVAQVGFAEWTTAGRLRHPRVLGLRFDKPARSVVREAA